MYDLRPKESCPCFDNLAKKTPEQLSKLLVSALKNQIEDLKKCEYKDPIFEKGLIKELEKAEKQAANYGGKK